MIRAVPVLLWIALDIFCLIDVIVSEDSRVRGIPKVLWFLLILIVPVFGSVLWLFLGRPRGATAQNGGRSPYERQAPAFPEYDRPGRAAGLSPESDEQFLRRVRERAEEQRRKAAEQKREQQRRDAAGGEQTPD